MAVEWTDTEEGRETRVERRRAVVDGMAVRTERRDSYADASVSCSLAGRKVSVVQFVWEHDVSREEIEAVALGLVADLATAGFEAAS